MCADTVVSERCGKNIGDTVDMREGYRGQPRVGCKGIICGIFLLHAYPQEAKFTLFVVIYMWLYFFPEQIQ